MTQTQTPPPAGSPTSEVDRLADGFWERFLELSPISATVNGDKRYDDRLPDPGPAGRLALYFPKRSTMPARACGTIRTVLARTATAKTTSRMSTTSAAGMVSPLFFLI